jgi:hypothetical protein
MDTSEVFALFETINSKLDRQLNKPIPVNLTEDNALAEQLKNVIEEIKKPIQIKHHHCHTIDIRSNWFFFSWVALVVIILSLFWTMANQRQTIRQYKDNDLKYRYIKMQEQTGEKTFYRLEQQFQYNDSIKIIRKQVERYEELIKKQAEKIEKAIRNTQEADVLRDKVESLKKHK